MIKVGIIGTHGVGKTTICHDLVSGLKKRSVNAEYLGEIARDAERAGFRLNEGTTPESQKWILYMQIPRELEFENRKGVDILVCDRISFDNYLYFVKKFGADAVLEQVVSEHVKTYSFIFKVPLNGDYLKHDGVRATDREFQKQMDEFITKELIRRRIRFNNFEGINSALEIILGKKYAYHQWSDPRPAI